MSTSVLQRRERGRARTAGRRRRRLAVAVVVPPLLGVAVLDEDDLRSSSTDVDEETASTPAGNVTF